MTGAIVGNIFLLVGKVIRKSPGWLSPNGLETETVLKVLSNLSALPEVKRASIAMDAIELMAEHDRPSAFLLLWWVSAKKGERIWRGLADFLAFRSTSTTTRRRDQAIKHFVTVLQDVLPKHSEGSADE